MNLSDKLCFIFIVLEGLAVACSSTFLCGIGVLVFIASIVVSCFDGSGERGNYWQDRGRPVGGGGGW